MAVTVTAATSKGQQLSDSEWRVVTGACDMMFQLDQAKTQVSPGGPGHLCSPTDTDRAHRLIDSRIRRISDLVAGTQHLGYRRDTNCYQDSRYRRWIGGSDSDSPFQHLRESTGCAYKDVH